MTMPEHLQNLIKSNLTDLVRGIQPKIETMWAGLVEKGVLTEETAEMIRTIGPPTQQVGELLSHLLKRPEKDFWSFCEVLRNTNQGHLVEAYLTPGSARPNAGQNAAEQVPPPAAPIYNISIGNNAGNVNAGSNIGDMIARENIIH